MLRSVHVCVGEGGGNATLARRGQFALGQNVPGGTYSPRADCPGGHLHYYTGTGSYILVLL